MTASNEPIQLCDEVGWVDVEIDKVMIRLDLWNAHMTLGELASECGKRDTVFCANVIRWLKDKGFPEVSSRTAEAFVSAVTARVRELKNAAAGGPAFGSPDSRGSTASASSDAAPVNS